MNGDEQDGNQEKCLIARRRRKVLAEKRSGTKLSQKAEQSFAETLVIGSARLAFPRHLQPLVKEDSFPSAGIAVFPDSIHDPNRMWSCLKAVPCLDGREYRSSIRG